MVFEILRQRKAARERSVINGQNPRTFITENSSIRIKKVQEEIEERRRQLIKIAQDSGLLGGLQEIEQHLKGTVPKTAITIDPDRGEISLVWGNVFLIENDHFTYQRMQRGKVIDRFIDCSYIVCKKIERFYGIEIGFITLGYPLSKEKTLDALATVYGEYPPNKRYGWESDHIASDKASREWYERNPPKDMYNY